jgi:hypothetical protein
MNIISRLFPKERAVYAVLISCVLLVSLFLSLSIFESNKTVFRLLKIVIFSQIALLVFLRFYHRVRLSKFELIFLLFPASALVAGLYNFGTGANLAYTIDGPVLFCMALCAMISFMILSGKKYLQFTRDGMILIFIAGAAVMSVSSYAGFISKLVSGAFGSTIDTFALAVIQQDNWNGVLHNPNAIATFFLMGIVADGLYFVLNRNRLSRTKVLALHTLTVVFFVNALLTQCRGVVLSAVIFAMILIVWYYHNEIKNGRMTRSRIMFVAGLISASLIALLLLQLRFGIVTTILEKTLSSETFLNQQYTPANAGFTGLNRNFASKTSFRIEFWRVYLDRNLFHPQIHTLVGYGYQPQVHHYNTVNTYYGMHNFVFEIWARYGLVALFGVCAALGSLVAVYLRRFGVDAFVLSLTAILIHNLFEDYVFFHIHLLTSMFFIYLIATLTVRLMTRRGGPLDS